jgi:uncharacterized membrane protein YeaQ/YmgE (transglycosylase-associated protein family)
MPAQRPRETTAVRFTAWKTGEQTREAHFVLPPKGERGMGIIAFIILGLLAGLIAKAILPGDDPGGIIVTTIIGIVGALLGGFLAAALFDAHPLDDFFDLSTWITAIVGSILLLLIYRLVVGRAGHRHRLGT